MKSRENASEVLAIGDPVRIQNTITKLWDETGVIDGVRLHGKSYFVQCDVGGAPGLRNRRHIKRREKSEPTEGALASEEISALRSASLLSTS